ncbi:hypothetical protein [Gorillibacterium sp. CAU 1737]|uniref:hypothetical protein n=1 Tax=Gorillibacterium sp. CAU 1737 TaxID=3140362 RepID=UPI00326127DA
MPDYDKRVLTLWGCIGVFLAYSLFLQFYPHPTKLDRTLDAVIYVDKDPSSVTKTLVRLKGTYFRPIWSKEQFDGRILIKGIPLTKTYSPFSVTATERRNGIHLSTLAYQSSRNEFEHSLIYYSPLFSKLAITAPASWVGNSDPHKSIVIVAPASTYEEAQAVLDSMRAKFGEGFYPPQR